MTEKPTRYFGIRVVNEGGRGRGFVLADSLERLKAWRESGPIENAVSLPTAAAPDEPFTTLLAKTDRERDLIRLFIQFRDAMGSSRSVIAFTSLALPAMQNSTLTSTILPFAKRTLDPLDDDEDFKSFTCNVANTYTLLKTLREYNDMCIGFAKLQHYVLLGTVATFDNQLSEIMKFFLALNPGRYSSGSRTIDLDLVAKAKDIDELKNDIMNSDIEEVMRGSHTQQVEYVEKI